MAARQAAPLLHTCLHDLRNAGARVGWGSNPGAQHERAQHTWLAMGCSGLLPAALHSACYVMHDVTCDCLPLPPLVMHRRPCAAPRRQPSPRPLHRGRSCSHRRSRRRHSLRRHASRQPAGGNAAPPVPAAQEGAAGAQHRRAAGGRTMLLRGCVRLRQRHALPAACCASARTLEKHALYRFLASRYLLMPTHPPQNATGALGPAAPAGAGLPRPVRRAGGAHRCAGLPGAPCCRAALSLRRAGLRIAERGVGWLSRPAE